MFGACLFHLIATFQRRMNEHPAASDDVATNEAAGIQAASNEAASNEATPRQM